MERENRALNDADPFDYVDELYAEDVVVNTTRTDDDQSVVSQDDIKAFFRQWKTAFPDLRVEVEHEVVEGDTVMQYVTMRGMHGERSAASNRQATRLQPQGSKYAVFRTDESWRRPPLRER